MGRYDVGTESAAGMLANFMDRQTEIKAAIIEAFDYDPLFTRDLDFDIEIHQSMETSHSERTKLVTDLLRELEMKKEWISLYTELMESSTQIVDSRALKTKLVTDLLGELDFDNELIEQYRTRIEMSAQLQSDSCEWTEGIAVKSGNDMGN